MSSTGDPGGRAADEPGFGSESAGGDATEGAAERVFPNVAGWGTARSMAIRFFAYGATLLGLRLTVELLGLSNEAQVLSGTQSGGMTETYLGLLYVLVRVGSVLLAPPLLLSGALLAAFVVLMRRSPAPGLGWLRRRPPSTPGDRKA